MIEESVLSIWLLAACPMPRTVSGPCEALDEYLLIKQMSIKLDKAHNGHCLVHIGTH